MPLIESFVPRAALCPGFLMVLSTLLKSVTTLCTREQYLRMIMWLLIKSVLKTKILLMTFRKFLASCFSCKGKKAYTLIKVPIVFTSDAMNHYFCNIGCEMNAQFTTHLPPRKVLLVFILFSLMSLPLNLL